MKPILFTLMAVCSLLASCRLFAADPLELFHAIDKNNATIEYSMAEYAMLIRPLEGIPLRHTGAADILQYYLDFRAGEATQAISRHGRAKGYDSKKIQRALIRFAEHTRTECHEQGPDAPNSVEQQAIKLHAKSKNLIRAIPEFLDDYCYIGLVETCTFDGQAALILLDYKVPLLVEKEKESYLVLGYVRSAEGKVNYLAADLSKVIRHAGSVWKGTLHGLHKVKDISIREEMRKDLAKRISKGGETLISITDHFMVTAIPRLKCLVVFTPEQLAGTTMTVIYPPEINQEAIEVLFGWF